MEGLELERNRARLQCHPKLLAYFIIPQHRSHDTICLRHRRTTFYPPHMLFTNVLQPKSLTGWWYQQDGYRRTQLEGVHGIQLADIQRIHPYSMPWGYIQGWTSSNPQIFLAELRILGSRRSRASPTWEFGRSYVNNQLLTRSG